tara:strand:- start:7191 stop:8099 length:909 start_codon:yes stop_codon:yes gene_type:complete
MKRVSLLVMCSIAFSWAVNAQKKKEQDQAAIKSMCGCYEVQFDFAETFEYANDSTYVPSQVKHDKGLEWVQLVEATEDKIVLQHLLIVGKPEKPMVIKHWRQDWLYENTVLYTYAMDNQWNFVSLPKKDVKGQWTQKVFQVDDSPRYEGSATWVHVDGKSFWENTANAPLPRREYTKRNDYNITLRTNRHEITTYGWIHDQDNDKVIRKEGQEDVLLAQEKGLNTYKKVADSTCIAAQDWWKENQEPWALVREKWNAVFAKHTNLKLKHAIEGKALYEYLFSKEFSNTKAAIDQTIDDFIVQ